MDSKTAMEAIKAASARGDLMEVERIYADACADIGNIIRDALNKIDDQMRQTLDEAQVVKA